MSSLKTVPGAPLWPSHPSPGCMPSTSCVYLPGVPCPLHQPAFLTRKEYCAPPPPLAQGEEEAEPEMDVRGGGQAFDDKRVVKDEDYASGIYRL